jgi:hypothetical protein
LSLARELGDEQHETELLWHQAIQHAVLGQRDQALAQAQAAVAQLQSRGNPQAAWFAHHLQAYRRGEMAAAPSGTSNGTPVIVAGTPLGGVILPSPWETQLCPPATKEPATSGARLLDMAFAAAKSMAKFLGSGLKMAAPEIRRQRLQVCGACGHHTGLRCRLCGCFTGPKAALDHEVCPLGKW